MAGKNTIKVPLERPFDLEGSWDWPDFFMYIWTTLGGNGEDILPLKQVETDAGGNLVATREMIDLVLATAEEIEVTDNGDGTVTIGIVDPLIVEKGGTGLATITDHAFILGSGTDPVTPLGPGTNGQLPIGSTGADPVMAGLTGTANQVIVSVGAGSITLSLPQDIATDSSPTFAALNIIQDTDEVGLTIKAIADQTEALQTLLDSSDNEVFKVRATGNIINIEGHTTTAAQYGAAFWAFAFGENAPEHTNQTGSYDHTGGAQERLFTKTAGDDFTAADADDSNWLLMTGENLGAVAEIKTFIDANNVIVDGMGWDSDLASQAFQVFKHPAFVTGDGFKHEFSVGADGEFEVHSYDFTGSYMAEIELESAADGTDGLLIKAEANGYNSVQALIIDYLSGDVQPGDTGGGMGVRLDISEATSADSTTELDAIIAAVIDGSDATTAALKVLPGFSNAVVVQGAEAIDMDYGYDVDDSVPTVTDRVTGIAPDGTAFLDSSATDVTLFSAVDDYVLIGNDDTFEIIEWTADTGSNRNIVPSFDYSTGNGTWAALTVLADGTQGFQQSGQISFAAPVGWAKGNEAEAAADITSAYYVRITRTRLAAIPTLPIEEHFKIYLDRATGMKIDGQGFIHPRHSADADAPNDTVYYSTDQSVLVYKDSVGAVNDLY